MVEIIVKNFINKDSKTRIRYNSIKEKKNPIRVVLDAVSVAGPVNWKWGY
jgi:hypothetical protein